MALSENHLAEGPEGWRLRDTAWAMCTCTRIISREEGGEASAKGGAWAPTRDGNQIID